MLEFRILGPLEVVEHDRPLVVGGPKQRAVLAVLLVHRGEVVSSDRLIDELWGERPPATAAKTLQGYVSNLRKALGDGLLLTRGPGYVLETESGQVDADRFAALVAEGRDRLRAGDARAARKRLREGLAQWRGPALADFAYEPFAQAEVARLEEARLAALEDRVDAELALGEGVALVSELESLVREHPLRERFQGQLMLALYRAGRQADALERYQQARRELIDRLGIEPGPALKELERAILNQDPALGAAPRQPRLPAPRRVARPVAVAGALLVLAAAAATVERLGGGGGASLAGARSDSVVALSPATGAVQASFPLGGNPTSVAVGGGAVWALSADTQTVTRIDLRGGGEQTFGTAGIPTDLAAGDGALWVGNGTRVGVPAPFPVVTTVARLDPDTAATLATVALPAGRPVYELGAYQIAVGPQGVWVINPDSTVSRIDPASDQIVQSIRDFSAAEVATGAAGTWAVENTTAGSIVQLSPDSDRVMRRVQVPGASLNSIAVGAGAVWAADPYAGVLWRIDPGPVPFERTIPLASGASDVAYGAGAVWVSNGLTGTVTRVDPRTNQVTKTISLGNAPGRLAIGGGAVWVAVGGARGVSVPAAAQNQSGVSALPASICGPVFSAGGHPQLLIASDLPLHGQSYVPGLQMSAAIAYVLRENDFRAGRFRLAYQSCDDSTSQSAAGDERKCASNANAWTRNPLVVGVIGPYNSGCAINEIPIANRGGPLAMLSPANSCPCLTHADPLLPPGFISQLYPTGARNYARVYPADDLQAAAMAEFAHRRRIPSVYVLADDSNPAAQDMALHFELAARRLGLQVVGSSTWGPSADTYARLAQQVASSGAHAAFLGGTINPGAVLIRALRQRLGPRVAILADDGFLPLGPLFQTAGSAARGLYISTAVVPNAPLPPAGHALVAHLGAIQHNAPVNLAALYAAQATEVMLNAIARSNGTRRSVTRAMLATCIHNGILGSFCFDANGDPTTAGISIVHAERPGGSTMSEDTTGADLVTVIYPPRALLR